MALTLEFNSQAPGITVQRIRSDFEAIWKKNIVEVTIERKTEAQAGDYFHEGENPGITTFKIWANVQGTSTGLYGREKAGLSTTGAQWHAYVRHSEDIRDLDVFIWNEKRFIIKNRNAAYHGGEIGFIEFDLFKVDND